LSSSDHHVVQSEDSEKEPSSVAERCGGERAVPPMEAICQTHSFLLWRIP